MLRKIFASPGRFVIGRGEIGNLDEYLRPYGDKAMLVAHADDAARVASSLAKIEAAGIKLARTNFGGECTKKEIARIEAEAKTFGAASVIGLGGGKAIDTAKCIANSSRIPLLVVPTIASTDAPCSSLAVVYDEKHVFDDCFLFPRNPDMVVVDSQVIAEAPPRFLAAGMADAYATYFEAKSCWHSEAKNFVGGVSTNAAYALAGLCREILLRDGCQALAACRNKVVTPALENIIEANLLLSGLGFESVGLSAAHGLHDALTVIPDTHVAMHGEKVAIGTLAQHILENESPQQIRQSLEFFKGLGLPTKLSDIGIKEDVDAKLRRVAEAAVKKGGLIFNLPFVVDAALVFAALKSIDSL